MAYEDTLRLLLQNKFDRVENLVQMNHAATLAVPSVLAAIWGISLKENGINTIPILCIISIILLLIWRYFAHYLDSDIAKTYIEIIRIENQLEVLSNISLFEKMVDSITKIKNCSKYNEQNKSLNQRLKQLCSNHQVKFFECLYDDNKMGDRGHKKWDQVSLILITIFLFSFIFFSSDFHVIILLSILTPHIFLVPLNITAWVFLFLILSFGVVFSTEMIQKDPNPIDLEGY